MHDIYDGLQFAIEFLTNFELRRSFGVSHLMNKLLDKELSRRLNQRRLFHFRQRSLIRQHMLEIDNVQLQHSCSACSELYRPFVDAGIFEARLSRFSNLMLSERHRLYVELHSAVLFGGIIVGQSIDSNFNLTAWVNSELLSLYFHDYPADYSRFDMMLPYIDPIGLVSLLPTEAEIDPSNSIYPNTNANQDVCVSFSNYDSSIVVGRIVRLLLLSNPNFINHRYYVSNIPNVNGCNLLEFLVNAVATLVDFHGSRAVPLCNESAYGEAAALLSWIIDFLAVVDERAFVSFSGVGHVSECRPLLHCGSHSYRKLLSDVLYNTMLPACTSFQHIVSLSLRRLIYITHCDLLLHLSDEYELMSSAAFIDGSDPMTAVTKLLKVGRFDLIIVLLQTRDYHKRFEMINEVCVPDLIASVSSSILTCFPQRSRNCIATACDNLSNIVGESLDNLMSIFTSSASNRVNLKRILAVRAIRRWLLQIGYGRLWFMLLRKRERSILEFLLTQVNEPMVLLLTRHSKLAQVPLLDSDGNTPLMYLLREVRGCRNKLVRMLLQHSPLDASQWLNLQQQSILQAGNANQHRNLYGESLYDLFCLERNLSIFGDLQKEHDN